MKLNELLGFPNASIAGIFWGALFSFSISLFLLWKSNVKYYILPFVICLGLFLVLSNGRAAWVGSFLALIFALKETNRFLKKLNYRHGFYLLAFLTVFLLFYKFNSSSGRIHIYKLTFSILKDHWRTGVGLGKFGVFFNEYQATYFSTHNIDSREAILADNCFYAFNDYIQFFTETGISGCILMLWFFSYFFFYTKYKLRNAYNSFIFPAIASLICIFSAALFSYPLHIIQIQGIALICFAIIIYAPVKNKMHSYAITIPNALFKIIFPLIGFFYLFVYSQYISTQKMEILAMEYNLAGKRKDAMIVYSRLQSNFILFNRIPGYYNYLQAKLYYYQNDLNTARMYFETGKNSYIDNDFYLLAANIENELGNYQTAERYFLRSIYMVPNKMRNRYALLKFYVDRKDSINVRFWANSILNMPVKIQNSKADIIKMGTQQILSNFSKK